MFMVDDFLMFKQSFEKKFFFFSDFKEVLEELDDVLESATFLAIDGEFTGLNSGPDTTIFDTPAQYYAKLRKGSMNFLLVQLGLSVFSYDKITNKCVAF